ncbi:MAG TPA: glycine cleavage system protein GcvH [Oligoflexus sp.]|jgi:glycine cleavage system H protein|uniref:glycine cleavage system protein GcvH n=1 Tax=Oligoflexus sp. TaxID=1971216 RepID=UPI002D7F0EB6|nr:glycine cleavage system protein GcvH [Oligoflexus sp.]HET9235776.1 glycine cleavage system protein GcvH [Oligoflexus sp.]
MSFPKDLKYTREHEWIRLENGKATIGVTGYALEQLGDVVHLELPKVGENFKAGATFGTIESTKTVSDLYMPITGKVTQVNTAATKNLEGLAEDPYKNGWLVQVEYAKEDGELISASEYEKYIADEE